MELPPFGVNSIARQKARVRGGPMSLGASAATPVLIPLRRFAGEIGRSRQFVYSEMKLGRLKTILHCGRRFIHHDERERYIAAVVAASPDYGTPGRGPSMQPGAST